MAIISRPRKMLCALTYTKQKKTSSATNMLVQSYFSHTFIRFASTPFPIANLRHVFTVLVDAGLVIEQLVASVALARLVMHPRQVRMEGFPVNQHIEFNQRATQLAEFLDAPRRLKRWRSFFRSRAAAVTRGDESASPCSGRRWIQLWSRPDSIAIDQTLFNSSRNAKSLLDRLL